MVLHITFEMIAVTAFASLLGLKGMLLHVAVLEVGGVTLLHHTFDFIVAVICVKGLNRAKLISLKPNFSLRRAKV